MFARFAVQCVVLLLCLALTACGGSDPTAVAPAAAVAAPARPHGHLRHSEYVRLMRLQKRSAHSPADVRSACRALGHPTRVLAQVQLECRSAARDWEAWNAAVPAARVCVAQRSAPCIARIIDRLAARLEALVRIDHAVHVAAVQRGLPHVCRAYLQASPRELAKAKRIAESMREMSAEIEGGVPQGVLSAIQRANAADRWAGRRHGQLKRLKRCARA